jgi:hypothetical protein
VTLLLVIILVLLLVGGGWRLHSGVGPSFAGIDGLIGVLLLVVLVVLLAHLLRGGLW